MQKFITLGLHCQHIRHGAVEEHLTDLLSDGWRIASVSPIGSAQIAGDAVVWVAVVLEKGTPAGSGAFLPGAQLAQGQGGSFMPTIEFPQSEEGVPVEPSDIPVGPDTDLEIGARVLSFSQGRWWRAEVVGLEPDDR
jgi:hypothetical protein